MEPTIAVGWMVWFSILGRCKGFPVCRKPVQIGTVVLPDSLTRYWSFFLSQAARTWHERIELYVCSRSVPLWHSVLRTLQ